MLADERDHRLVTVEIAVPALRFVHRVAHIGVVAVTVTEVRVFRPRFAVPGPEIRARYRTARGRAVGFGRVVDNLIVALAERGRHVGGVELSIAREAEFLNGEGFARVVSNANMGGEVIFDQPPPRGPGAF